MNDRLEKILFNMFDDLIEGVDQYNHQGSLWLILTDERKWILEFTKTKTLWYNYTIFKDRMSFAAMDCVENKEYITKWFESRFLNKPKAQDTLKRPRKLVQQVEDAIENGVKNTKTLNLKIEESVEDTIQNGVKETELHKGVRPASVEDTIQNGVKHTEYGDWLDGDERFDDIIQNGVKHTEKSLQIDGSCVVEDVIQNGIKETHDDVYHHKGRVGGVIKNGIKETKLIDYSDNTEFIVNGVISRGIKE